MRSQQRLVDRVPTVFAMLHVAVLCVPLLAETTAQNTPYDDFTSLDQSRWQAVNMFGARELPGLSVTAADGVLRIAGTTSAEGINLGGVRTRESFSARPDQPFELDITRAYHGGRQVTAELGVMLWRSMGEFVYVREPLESQFKDWNHYQSWQAVLSDERRPSTRLQFTDISDEHAFLATHAQPLFDCRMHRVPRRVRLVHDGSRVTVFLDGRQRHVMDVPWNTGFVVCLVAGAHRSAIPIDVGFSEVTIKGHPDRVVAAVPIDVPWQTALPSYWAGDAQLLPDAVDQVLSRRGQPQLAMVVRSGWPRATIKQFIDWSAEHGLNCIALDIPWRDVERVPGQFDFSASDGIVNYAVNRGLFVQLKPWWIRRGYPDWISPELEQLPVGPGKHLTLQELTFAHEPLNDRIARFVGAVVAHYRHYPVTCYTPVGATAAELEYSHADYRDGSRWSVTQFQEWLTHHYGTIEALNGAWNTDYTAWTSVTPPASLQPVGSGPDTRRQVLDWFAYREWSIKQLVDRMAAAAKAADPAAVLAVQMGRILDGPLCPKRATVGAFYWAANADMLIVDPQPKDGDSMGYIIDVIRSGNMQAGMELDAPARFELPLDQYRANSLECWRHGGTWASWANWAVAELEQPEIVAMTRGTVAELGNQPGVSPPDRALFVSKWDLYCYHDGNRWREYRDAYVTLTDGGKQVIDVLTDDMVLKDPHVLATYAQIVVPYADCLDRRVHDVLIQHKERLTLQHTDEFAKYLLDIAQ